MLQRAVIYQTSMTDHHGASAQFLHILQVVARQKHRRSIPPVIILQEIPDIALGNKIHTDGRLVQKYHPGTMQKGRDHLHFHPFPKGKTSDLYP